MSLIDIGGKDYEPVASRIGRFRAERPLWALTTEIVVDDERRVLMRALLHDEEGRLIATGTAEEDRSGRVAKMGAIEVCETSAIGRCLGIAGYDLAGQVCSAEEMANAIERTEPDPGSQLERARAWFAARDLGEGRSGDVAAALNARDLPRLRALRQAELAGDARIAAKGPKTAGNGQGGNIPAEWRDESLRACEGA